MALIIMLSGFCVSRAYVYNSKEEASDSSLILADETFSINYKDGNYFETSYLGNKESMVKHLTITNVSNSATFVSISLMDINKHNDKMEVKLVDRDGIIVYQDYLGNMDTEILKTKEIGIKETLTYDIVITNLGDDDNYGMSANIMTYKEIRKKEQKTFKELILETNEASKMTESDYLNNFTDSGLFVTEDDEGLSYVFRGNVNNNYVIYAGFCFRIIRTAEGNSVRMQYAGVPTSGSCPSGTVSAPITSTIYNQTKKDNAFIGYRVGLSQACGNTTTCNTITYSTSYNNAHKGTADSNAKKAVDLWMQNNIYTKGTNTTKHLANTVYCSDRKITNASGGYTGSSTQLGYGNNTTDYDPLLRFNSNSPSFNCINENDRFSNAVTSGNGELSYPAALITMDELLYAGASKSGTSTFYLANGNQYFTMTPAAYKYNSSISSNDSYIFNIDASGTLGEVSTWTSGKLFPVITLRGDTIIESGTGLRTSPYVIGE